MTPITVKGRVTGYVSDCGQKYVTERRHRHYAIKYDGFGISASLLMLLHKTLKGLRWIVIRYIRTDGTEEVFITTPDHWLAHGKHDQLGDYEPQVFLRKEEFTKR